MGGDRVAVTLVTGFLGAGKTTTVRGLARHLAGRRLAIVVNDFGEAEVDRALLGEDGAIRAIAGGCVCCTAPAGFVSAVGELVDAGAEWILVEPTGLAHPADLLDTLRRAPYADRLAIGPVIGVVDPSALSAGVVPADLVAQLALSDVLVANRVDLATPQALAAFRAWAAALDPAPIEVVETEHGRVGPHVLDWPAEEGPRAPGRVHHAHDDHHDHAHAEAEAHGFLARSWVWPPDAVFDRAGLLAAMRATSASGVARAKGLLRTDEGWVELQVAGGVLHERPTPWRRDSRLDVLDRDAALLATVGGAVEAARLAPAALAERGLALELGGRTVDRAWLQALPDQVPDVGAAVPGRSGAGVRVRAVLEAAGVPVDGTLVVVARDGYTTPPVPAEELAAGILVHSLGDGPLGVAQGGPFRLLVPGRADACANVKGVVRLASRSPTGSARSAGA